MAAMTGRQLVEWLLSQPADILDLPVYVREGSGCSECNPEGMDYYTEASDPRVADEFVNGYRKPMERVIVL